MEVAEVYRALRGNSGSTGVYRDTAALSSRRHVYHTKTRFQMLNKGCGLFMPDWGPVPHTTRPRRDDLAQKTKTNNQAKTTNTNRTRTHDTATPTKRQKTGTTTLQRTTRWRPLWDSGAGDEPTGLAAGFEQAARRATTDDALSSSSAHDADSAPNSHLNRTAGASSGFCLPPPVGAKQRCNTWGGRPRGSADSRRVRQFIVSGGGCGRRAGRPGRAELGRCGRTRRTTAAEDAEAGIGGGGASAIYGPHGGARAPNSSTRTSHYSNAQPNGSSANMSYGVQGANASRGRLARIGSVKRRGFASSSISLGSEGMWDSELDVIQDITAGGGGGVGAAGEGPDTSGGGRPYTPTPHGERDEKERKTKLVKRRSLRHAIQPLNGNAEGTDNPTPTANLNAANLDVPPWQVRGAGIRAAVDQSRRTAAQLEAYQEQRVGHCPCGEP
ncbi:hypothetical protein B0H13DRAFT_2426607 [Mycena leptocephala]|nr:hypothetical protein B0H13DRAFT_2426607 [Mycena leptocephala]